MSGASRASIRSLGLMPFAWQCAAALSMTADNEVSCCVKIGSEACDMERDMGFFLGRRRDAKELSHRDGLRQYPSRRLLKRGVRLISRRSHPWPRPAQ